ncbi:glutamate receptor -like [Olea europaea subsp. europaea]|uniref:Glutamate receptor n=2 Tax=Olea europaea subsp. europaea TaxID=158383 RepID=A0A8S0U762_OLEEU|nr:glutamate receptor -like [Olea europaea subsp. europaea]
MDFLLLQFLISLLLLPSLGTEQNSTDSIINVQVGVVLDLDSPVGRIGKDCLYKARSDFYSFHRNHTTKLVLHLRDSKETVIDAAAAALDLLQNVKVDAIIGPQKSTQASFVMDLGDRASVPILSFSATSPSLIPRTRYFVQTAQSDADQVKAIASIVMAFSWNQVVIIYEDTEYGNGIISYLSNALQDVNARVSNRSVFPKSATDDFICKELYKMMTMQTRVFVVHMSQHLGARLFLKSKELGMMSNGYAWIVTSGLTDLFSLMDVDVVEAMQGVLGVKPLIPKRKELDTFPNIWNAMSLQVDGSIKPTEVSIFGLWAYDTLWALAMAAERIGNKHLKATKNGVDSNSEFPFSLGISKAGPKLLKEILRTRFQGRAGVFHLADGELVQTPYQIVNIVGKRERLVGIWSPSYGISKEVILNVTTSYSTSKENFRIIIWPGNSVIAPKGWEFPVNGKKLRVGVSEKSGFNEFLKVVRVPQSNAINVSGYFKEVFDSVMEALPYSVPYEYVLYPFENSDGSSAGSYDNFVYQVSLQEKYDAALGDITITANRSIYVDFTFPYAEGGVASVVPIKYDDRNDKWTFLQPLTKELWLMSATFYIFTGLSIWILGRRIETSCRDSAGQHAGMICCFPFFPGQGIEGNLICLVLVTWAFVANLLISTYTASLSSRLTVQRLQPAVTDVMKLIRSGDYIGCQEGSFLVDFLKGLGFEESKIRTYKSTHDCDEALTNGNNGGISAYFDVLPHINLFLSEFCGKYMIVGPTYRTGGFAFAFPKGLPLVADVSRAIIQLTENGTIVDIGQMNSSNPACAGPESAITPNSMTLQSFQVLFAITGCVTIACLLVSLIIYLYKNRGFLQGVSNFNVSIWSRIHALCRYFVKIDLSSRSKAGHTKNQIQKT